MEELRKNVEESQRRKKEIVNKS